jgi:hypothetical protein
MALLTPRIVAIVVGTCLILGGCSTPSSPPHHGLRPFASRSSKYDSPEFAKAVQKDPFPTAEQAGIGTATTR